MNRRAIQQQHEAYVVDRFLHYWKNVSGEGFRIVEKPDPPDAVVQSEARTTWIEVGDVYVADNWAHALFSCANPNEDYAPFPPGPYTSISETFASRFLDVLQNKLSKKSYAVAEKQHGPGILLLMMQSPWFGDDCWNLMVQRCRNADWAQHSPFFSDIFVAYHHMNDIAFEAWQHCPAKKSGQARKKEQT